MTAPVEDTERVGVVGAPTGGAAKRRGLSRGRLVVVAVALAGLVGVFLLTRDRGGEPTPPPASDPAVADELPVDPLTGVPEGYRTYRDDETGFTLAHPETWVPIARPDESRRLLLNAGGDSSLSVRYSTTEEPIASEADLQKVLPVTDRIAQGTEGVKVLKRQAFNLNGLNGISYLSRFTDEETGRSLVNAQYFLFQDRKWFTVLFQVAPDPPVEPEEQFERMLPHINAVLDSFTVDPPAPEEASPPPSD